MNAYKLGDALGKVVLGPADCGPILAEKAGHFLTRLIIEHVKIQFKKQSSCRIIRRIDSGFAPSNSYKEYRPICKAQGTQARAKCYDRVVFKTKWASFDWIENTIGVQAMLDDDYDLAPDPPEKPWISIFTSTEDLLKHMNASPILYRMLKEASKPQVQVSTDPFATSYLFNKNKVYWAEGQIQEAFTEFHPHNFANINLVTQEDKSNPLKKLNHSISHLKLNIRKYRSKHDLLDESVFSEDTMVDEPSLAPECEKEPQQKINGATNMRNVMKKMIKMGGISQQQGKDRRINKILV
jgi:hypothetical protein